MGRDSVLSNRRDIRPYSTDSIRPPYRKTMKVSLLNVPVRAVFLLMLCIFASVQAAPVNRSAEESTMMASQQVFNNIQQQMNNFFFDEPAATRECSHDTVEQKQKQKLGRSIRIRFDVVLTD